MVVRQSVGRHVERAGLGAEVVIDVLKGESYPRQALPAVPLVLRLYYLPEVGQSQLLGGWGVTPGVDLGQAPLQEPEGDLAVGALARLPVQAAAMTIGDVPPAAA
jgi:hypothetical protein